MKIAVVYSLPTQRALDSPYIATEEDTKDSALEVFDALLSKGAQPFLIPVSEDSIETLRTLRADVVFNLIEWSGLDLPLSLTALGILESLGIPVTGATLTNFAVTMDKIKMKEALDVFRLPTPRWQLFTTGKEPVRDDLVYPVIMKLAWEHCSVGLTRDAVVTSQKDLAKVIRERIRIFKQPLYVEEFIEGREFQVTVLEKENGPWVLPPAEIIFRKDAPVTFLTFESRWDEQHPDYSYSTIELAKLTPSLLHTIERVSLESFTALGFRDYARLDIRIREDTVYILEPNANPGLGDSDEYGMTVSYKAVGMTFADFVWEIVVSALRRKKSSGSRKNL